MNIKKRQPLDHKVPSMEQAHTICSGVKHACEHSNPLTLEAGGTVQQLKEQ